ncbi:MAG: hypothetical protein J6Q19_00620 [Bacteroidaceae bacterium]|nr:hypothetical protein [Bacteroidaceae bacterium]
MLSIIINGDAESIRTDARGTSHEITVEAVAAVAALAEVVARVRHCDNYSALDFITDTAKQTIMKEGGFSD